MESPGGVFFEIFIKFTGKKSVLESLVIKLPTGRCLSFRMPVVLI